MPEAFTTVLTTVWTQVTTCIGTVKEEPLLLTGVGIGFAGAIVGLTKRFLRFGGRRR